jgi:hypothetical protein
MFIKIRQTWFPVDSIDQIDDIGGRLRISLSMGVKIDLDPIETEKVVKQIREINKPPAAMEEKASFAALTARVMGVEGSLGALEDRIEALRRELEKDRKATGKVTTNA